MLQRAQTRSAGRCENSNGGAAGRMGAPSAVGLTLGGGGANVDGGAKNEGTAGGGAGGAGGGAGGGTGASPRGGVGATTPAPSPEIRRFPQS